MSKRRILHVVQYDFNIFKGGIQRYVKDLSKLQYIKGYEVIIYSSRLDKAPKNEISNGMVIKRFRSIELFRTPIALGMISEFIKYRFDIVHIHAQFPIIGEIIALIAKLRGIPVITTYHNEIELVNTSLLSKIAYNIWSRVMLPLLLNISDSIIVTTHEFLCTSKILADTKYHNKIHIIPCGLFIDFNKRQNNIIGIGKEGYLLYVGRIKPEKGLHVLINALYIAKKNNIDIKLVIVGEANREDELEYKSKLESMIKEYNLIDNVKFVGKVSDEDLDNYYIHAAALILPSLSRLEGFGIVQLEAMKYGIPIIVSDLPGPKSVTNGVAITVRPNDPMDLYKSILAIMYDKRLRQEIKELSMKRVAMYDWNLIFKRIEELYYKALN